MAVSIVINRYWKEGKVKKRDFTVTFDSSYPTNGEVITPANLLFDARIDNIIPFDYPQGYVPSWDQVNGKMRMFYGNYDAADGPLIEVPNTTDIQTATVRAVAEGY